MLYPPPGMGSIVGWPLWYKKMSRSVSSVLRAFVPPASSGIFKGYERDIYQQYEKLKGGIQNPSPTTEDFWS